MQKDLVSIISPCYNKEKVIARFLDSIVQQTYRPIELIIIDDGSTDKSKEVVQSYIKTFREKEIQHKYIYQENAGLGAAINTGLRHATGEFLCWPDTDDWYEPTATERKVAFLKSHPEYAIVSSDANVFFESKIDTPAYRQNAWDADPEDENQFYYLLWGKSSPCTGLHMVRLEELMSVLVNGQIFPSRHGQNLQLLLPVYYHFKRGYLDEPLYNYVIYDDSMSHKKESFEQTMSHRAAMVELKETVVNTIPDIAEEDREKAIRIINTFEARKRLKIAAEFNNPSLAAQQVEWLKVNNALSKRDIQLYREVQNPAFKAFRKKGMAVLEKIYKAKKQLFG